MSEQERELAKVGITQLIGRIDAGDNVAQSELCTLVYAELQAIGHRMRRRSAGCSLATTDAVNEFLSRILADGRLGQMKNRRYLYAAAADQMRRLLIDHWRRKRCKKRGGDRKREDREVWLDEPVESAAARCGGDFEALETALEQLKRDRPRQYEIVQCKFFAGLTNEQIAESFEISVDTVKREWRIARAR